MMMKKKITMGSVEGFPLSSCLRLLPGSVEHLVPVEVSLAHHHHHHEEEENYDEDDKIDDNDEKDDLNEDDDDDACWRAL